MNEKMEMNQDEMEIDLKDLFNALKKKNRTNCLYVHCLCDDWIGACHIYHPETIQQ